MTFNELNLIEPITRALSKKGYLTPTPVQEQAIPHILAGKDLFGSARTGTGKTGAFALPILQLLHQQKPTGGIETLILAPTRELAIQISESFTAYGSNLGIRQAVLVGGVAQGPQVKAIRQGARVLIATPGRLTDLLNQNLVRLDKVKYFVLDEADRMLDIGFIHDIKKVVKLLPAKKQTLFFSATIPKEIQELSASLLTNPVRVSTSPVSSTSEHVEQTVYYVGRKEKQPLLEHLLTSQDIRHVLVFTRTKRGADKVVKDLTRSGVSALAIHGNKSQGARQKALKGFKDRTLRVLVATDIAARGIDIDKLSHVINYDLPDQAETYVHRIGRTGRAGMSGKALSFCDRDESGNLRDIKRLITVPISEIKDHPFVQIQGASQPRTPQPRRTFGGQGQGQGQGRSQNKGQRRFSGRRSASV